MRAQRILARLATAGAMIAAVVAATLVAPGVAAAHHDPYPAPSSSLTVSSGTVTVGRSVTVFGNGFARDEIVKLTVRYQMHLGQGSHGPSVSFGAGSVRANNHGKFSKRISLWVPGTATITANGLRSGKIASAAVRVVTWGRYGPRFFGAAYNDTESAKGADLKLVGNKSAVAGGTKAGKDSAA
jgi:hypothetical protein